MANETKTGIFFNVYMGIWVGEMRRYSAAKRGGAVCRTKKWGEYRYV
jgi:hypothetical protein